MSYFHNTVFFFKRERGIVLSVWILASSQFRNTYYLSWIYD